MDSHTVVSTDIVCKNSQEKLYLKYKNVKEAIFLSIDNSINSMFKKVGLPTLVSCKKSAHKYFSKKAGMHPIGMYFKKWVGLEALSIIVMLLLLSTRPLAITTPSHSTSYPTSTPWPCPSSPSPATSPQTETTATLLLTWSQGSLSTNKLGRIINGNGRKGYRIALWNCRRGLIAGEKKATTKLVEVQQFIQTKNLHVLCLVESDLHSQISRYRRRHPLNTQDIHNSLAIPGYQIVLPMSWQAHGQARVIMFVKDDINLKIRDIGAQNSDLPTISCEISLGREKKTIINFFYREFMSGVSGLKDSHAQVERLARQVKIWKALCAGTKDVICMGDANLCAMRWLEEDYENKILGDMVQNFMMESSFFQLVNENTRSEVIQGNMVSKTCIDHCYTNAPEKISKPEVLSVGTSDHLGVVVTKYSKVEKSKPQTVKKRSYKNFKVEDFLTEIFESKINESVTECDDIDAAAETFEKMFREILDEHAPVKVFQMRKNYTPYLSEETKLLMKEQKILKEEITRNGDVALTKELKIISKKISKNIKEDEKDYFENGMSDKVDVSTAWKTANELLGIKKNLPQQL